MIRPGPYIVANICLTFTGLRAIKRTICGEGVLIAMPNSTLLPIKTPVPMWPVASLCNASAPTPSDRTHRTRITNGIEMGPAFSLSLYAKIIQSAECSHDGRLGEISRRSLAG